MNGALVLVFNRILQALPLLVSAIIFLGTSGGPAGAVSPSEIGGKPPASVSPTPEKRLQLQETFGRLPLVFVENRGQTTSEVRFYHQGRGLGTFFTPEGIFWKVETRDRHGRGGIAPSRRHAIMMEQYRGSAKGPDKAEL